MICAVAGDSVGAEAFGMWMVRERLIEILAELAVLGVAHQRVERPIFGKGAPRGQPPWRRELATPANLPQKDPPVGAAGRFALVSRSFGRVMARLFVRTH